MFEVDRSQFEIGGLHYSSNLQRYTRTVSRNAVAAIRRNSDRILIGTGPTSLSGSDRTKRMVLATKNEELSDRNFRAIGNVATDREISQLKLQFPSDDFANLRWISFELKDDSAPSDQVILALKSDEDIAKSASYLERIWPILREDCLNEQTIEDPEPFEAQGGGWGLLDQVQVAVIVLDGAGLMYRLNMAARIILDEEKILKRGRGGVFTAVESDNQLFRATLAKQASDECDDENGTLVFVHDAKDRTLVPISISRFVHKGAKTQFVVATMPVPISAKRVETLGKRMGLTATEARVAAQIQKGLTNRDAALASGLKEQTFKTYSKRVLSKLNVSCRSEMAQLLTWQVSGGRLYDKS